MRSINRSNCCKKVYTCCKEVSLSLFVDFNFKVALVSAVKTAYAADSCTTLDDDQDVGPAIQQDSLTETDVESMLANCLSSWLSSEPNGQALIEFVKSCEDEGV